MKSFRSVLSAGTDPTIEGEVLSCARGGPSNGDASSIEGEAGDILDDPGLHEARVIKDVPVEGATGDGFAGTVIAC